MPIRGEGRGGLSEGVTFVTALNQDSPMRHFEEILLTLGGTNPQLRDESPNWSFWTVEYPTPASTVNAAYLYLKTKCPLKEATSALLNHWSSLSPTRRYSAVLPPRSPLARDLKNTGEIFDATEIRTPNRLLFENLLASLQFKKIDEEEHFIDPDIQDERRVLQQGASQVLYRWLTGATNSPDGKTIGVLTAPGGLGKTTLCRILCNQIHSKNPFLIPLLIESTQWQSHIRGDLQMADVWDIAISRTFERPTRLLSNEMALRVLIREGVFLPVFDGFDELCLNPSADYGPEDLINQLSEMLEPEDDVIQARILLTTRETFWQTFSDRIHREHVCVFNLQGFSNQQEHEYFRKRLNKPPERDVALRLAKQVSGKLYEAVKGEDANSERLSGVPFILDMIARYVEDNPTPENINPYAADPLAPLLEAICRRENVRQKLGVTHELQLTFFEELFRDSNEVITVSAFKEYLHVICDVHEPDRVKGFSNHFLLRRLSADTFEPRYEILKVYFVARFLAKSLADVEGPPRSQRRRVAEMLAKNATGSTEIIDWLLSQLRALDPLRLRVAIRHAKQIISEPEQKRDFKLAGSALFLLTQRLIVASDRSERSYALADFLAEDGSISNRLFHQVVFAGHVRAFDFAKASFVGCTFVNVVFKNCHFDETSVFDGCDFLGILEFESCSGAEQLKVTQNCSLSGHAELAFDQLLARPTRDSTRRTFAEEAMLAALRKFRGQFGFTSIQYRRRLAGIPATNPYHSTVWDFLFRHKIIERHHISNVADGGMNVRDDSLVRKDVRAYIDNGVIGPILRHVIDDIIK